jgi:hypothetical protein
LASSPALANPQPSIISVSPIIFILTSPAKNGPGIIPRPAHYKLCAAFWEVRLKSKAIANPPLPLYIIKA